MESSTDPRHDHDGTTVRRFRVMGTYGEVIVVGGPDGLASRAERRLAELERRWSRFRPDSELSRLNLAGGAPCVVSPDTVALVEAMRTAWTATRGRFDPTLHDDLVRLGYGVGWEAGTLAGEWSSVGEPSASLTRPDIRTEESGCAGIEIAARAGIVRLPPWVRLDPGGLGKGLAADLVAAEALEGGADGVLVNVGGDLRVAGTPPRNASASPVGRQPGWLITVEDPAPGRDPIAEIELLEGGIATTTSARRRWTTADGHVVHHVLDPATRRPAESSRVQATVLAGSAWWAEVLATVAFLDGRLDEPHAAALLVDDRGAVSTLGDAPRWFRTLP